MQHLDGRGARRDSVFWHSYVLSGKTLRLEANLMATKGEQP